MDECQISRVVDGVYSKANFCWAFMNVYSISLLSEINGFHIIAFFVIACMFTYLIL